MKKTLLLLFFYSTWIIAAPIEKPIHSAPLNNLEIPFSNPKKDNPITRVTMPCGQQRPALLNASEIEHQTVDQDHINLMNSTMKRNVGILIFDNAEVLDFAGPFEVFSVTSELNNHELFNVFTIAKEKSPVTAVNGLSVNPTYSFHNAPVNIEILILSGGAGTRQVIRDAETLEWIRKVHGNSEITASICSGSRMLATLGLLDNLEYVTHHDVFEHIQEIAPQAIPNKNERYIDHGKIMTSGGISAGIDLSLHIVEKLLGTAIKEKTATYMEYRLYEE